MEYVVWVFVAGWWYTSASFETETEAMTYFNERKSEANPKPLRVEANNKVVAWFHPTKGEWYA